MPTKFLTTPSSPRDVAIDLLQGAVAGAAATWVMGRVTTQLYRWEGREVRAREERTNRESSSTGAAADKLAAMAGAALTANQRERAGEAIHWAIGTAAGAAYALLRRRWPSAAKMGGVPFGAGFFLVGDELMNPLLGLTPGPSAYPWQAHARGLAGHLTFGATTELILGGLDRIPWSRT
jgi:hypothetical protein